MNKRQVAILFLLALVPLLAALPLFLLPGTDGADKGVPPKVALQAWSEEVRTGAQLPDAVPARRFGRAVRHDGRTWMTLRRGDECWGLPTDELDREPERLELEVCAGR